ncbi:MAG: hypothetical protein JXX28_00760 [Deltaproteobacteria bacterium]|nr:hypothetical protein [Deltaproteobacteria bacterium]
MRAMWLLVLGLGACSFPTEDFVYEATVSDCTWAMDCLEDDVLTFYGWDSQETCQEDRGPVLSALSVGCAEYEKRAAKDCIEALEARTCGDAEITWPSVCDGVYTSCGAE